MLLSFHVKNSRSILDITIPMTYGERKAPNGYEEMELSPFLEAGAIRTVPCLAMYGANASGKSNIVKAFLSLTGIVRRKYLPATYSPNKLHPEDSIISYALEFLKNGHTYRYTLETDNREIVSEKLEENSTCMFSVEKRTLHALKITTDVYTEDKLSAIFSVECLNQERLFQTPFLTVVGKNYAGLNTSMSAAFSYIINNIEVYPNNNFPFSLSLGKLAGTYENKEVQAAFDDIVSILRKLDIDITRMEYTQNVI